MGDRLVSRTVDELSAVINDNIYKTELRSGGYCKEEGNEYVLESQNLGSMRVTASRCTSAIFNRRSWGHIRGGEANFYIMLFPIEGGISVSQDNKDLCEVHRDSFTIISGNRPLTLNAFPDPEAEYLLAYNIVVPTHIMRSIVPGIDKICGTKFMMEGGPAPLTRNLFGDLLSYSPRISDSTAERLAIDGVSVIAESIRGEASLVQAKAKSARFGAIHEYIKAHLTDVGLSAESVAAKNNISRRYLHYILKENDTSFGKLVWDSRLEQAREWILSPEYSHHAIVDVAYMAGFRSASHFTHAFRARFGLCPRDARAMRQLAS